MCDLHDPTNEERAATAYAALESQEKYQDDPEGLREMIADLMADLMHLAHQEGYDPEGVIDTARMNYEAEI